MVAFSFQSVVHGIAFAIPDEAAITYLSNRECRNGGYEDQFITFYPLEGHPIQNVLVYIAKPNNTLWLGEAPCNLMASQILEASGDCGYNVEYVVRLANFMRQYFPKEIDYYLFNLERELMTKIIDRKLCLKTFMGEESECLSFSNYGELTLRDGAGNQDQERTNSFENTTRETEKTLRCLKI